MLEDLYNNVVNLFELNYEWVRYETSAIIENQKTFKWTPNKFNFI